MILDGELFCGRGNFDQASGLVRSFGGKYPEWQKSVTYQVFDAPLLEGSFEQRMKQVKPVVDKMKHAQLVVQEVLTTEAQFDQKFVEVVEAGGEGLMLRKKGSAYDFKRSSSLLKVKKTNDSEAEVIGHEDGKGRNKGRCGALVCQLPSGVKFNCGSGLTDAERDNPPPIGATITFGYMELTKNGVPRHPTFIRVFVGH
jgi:DNA ligase-1